MSLDPHEPPRPSSVQPGAGVLGEAAQAPAAPFVDPVMLRRAHEAWMGDPSWARDVLGLPPTATARDMRGRQLAVLVAAAQIDADWLAARGQAARARACAVQDAAHAQASQVTAALHDLWAQIVADLPVQVQVRHNWSRGHFERQVTGRDHVVVTDELITARMQRAAWTALCETGSKSRDLTHLDRNPDSTYATDRVPSCTRCITLAQKMTGREPTGALEQ